MDVEVGHRLDVLENGVVRAGVAKVPFAMQRIGNLVQFVTVMSLQQKWMLSCLAELGESGRDP
eukprot:scaffold52841_cov36-Tisochrysis_lutea.AAC.1